MQRPGRRLRHGGQKDGGEGRRLRSARTPRVCSNSRAATSGRRISSAMPRPRAWNTGRSWVPTPTSWASSAAPTAITARRRTWSNSNYIGSHGGAADSVEKRRDGEIPGWITGTDVNPGAITGVWAEKNTRGAIHDAMRARETFATSGTRIRPRFFGGALSASRHGLPLLIRSPPSAGRCGRRRAGQGAGRSCRRIAWPRRRDAEQRRPDAGFRRSTG